jgi:hypothetical protein
MFLNVVLGLSGVFSTSLCAWSIYGLVRNPHGKTILFDRDGHRNIVPLDRKASVFEPMFQKIDDSFYDPEQFIVRGATFAK